MKTEPTTIGVDEGGFMVECIDKSRYPGNRIAVYSGWEVPEVGELCSLDDEIWEIVEVDQQMNVCYARPYKEEE